MSRLHVFGDGESTFLNEESLDLLAKKQGQTEEVKRYGLMNSGEWTPDAQYRSVLSRAQLLQVTPDKVEELSRQMTPVSGARQFVSDMDRLEIPLVAISGGIKQIIGRAMERVGFKTERLYAPHAEFNEGDQIIDVVNPTMLPEEVSVFDKGAVMDHLMEKDDIGMMIGDGMNDMRVGERHIKVAFTQVASRPKVLAHADVVARDFQDAAEIVAASYRYINELSDATRTKADIIAEVKRRLAPSRAA